MIAFLTTASISQAADLVVDLGNSKDVTLVGAIARWDQDGAPRRVPDQKAKIDAPQLDATASHSGDSQWTFKDLPHGKYDLVIFTKNRLRIEGFQYAPVKDFDPFIAPDATVEDDSRDAILEDIGGSKHYENKVVPLLLAGDTKAVRVLMMLVRDKTTSYESEMPGAATIRHEIWQYSWNYGGWQKEKRTLVLDRVLLPRDELRKWTWLWDTTLGGLAVGSRPLTIKYDLPGATDRKLKGLYPY